MAHLVESPVTDWTTCPFVEINPFKLSGTPILRHSRMPADGIVENYMSHMSAEEIAEVFDLPVDGVRALLNYVVERYPALRR